MLNILTVTQQTLAIDSHYGVYSRTVLVFRCYAIFFWSC